MPLLFIAVAVFDEPRAEALDAVFGDLEEALIESLISSLLAHNKTLLPGGQQVY